MSETRLFEEPLVWLTREQIDKVIEGLSAADLIEATGDGRKDVQVAGAAFDSAAARLGISNGTPATQHIRASDYVYMAGQLGGAVNVDAPLSEETSNLLDSAAAGE